jgi:hypothetical protein
MISMDQIKELLTIQIDHRRNSIDELNNLIREVALASPDYRSVIRDLIAGAIVCKYYLGSGRLEKYLNTLSPSTDVVNELLLQNKFMRLGHYLYALRETKNFSHLIDGFKRKEFDAALSEIYCAYIFKDSGNQIEFVQESGIRGEDFDLRVVTKDERFFNVECKNRSKESNNKKTLDNVINNSYDQFPPDSYDNVLHIIINKTMNHPKLGDDMFGFLQAMDQLFMIIITYWEWTFYDSTGTLVGFPQHSKFSIRPDADELPTVEQDSGNIGAPSFAHLYCKAR